METVDDEVVYIFFYFLGEGGDFGGGREIERREAKVNGFMCFWGDFG